MKHIENFQMDSSPIENFEVKTEYFTIASIKEDIPDLLLDDHFMKTEFPSDEESLIGTNINLELHNESDTSEDLESSLKNEVRRNRRKALIPQRAVHSGSIENTSESSQDIVDNLEVTITPDQLNQNACLNMLLTETENLIDPSESDVFLKEISEQDIFKDLHNEADGEKVDDEIIDNVKEEWRAHWGIKCNMCEQIYQYKIKFDEHYMLNYNLTPIYTCTFCNKTAEKYSTFRSHCYRHITEGRYKCEECPKGFTLRSLLQVHILSKHTKAKPFVCEECGRSFVTKPGLKIHMKKHKTEIKEDYPCVECGKILHTRGGLTSHMNVHRLGRRFMCDVCGKTFTQKVNMQQHVKQHTGDKPHACDKCGKTFAEKSHLARHYSFHSEERPFKCKVCQKMYKTERCLKVHSLVHAAARPFVCDCCHKGFLSSTKLRQHYNIHTGERPFKCNYCERTFTNYPNWLKHTRRRHKVDHKTGENLKPAPPKDKVQLSPLVSTETSVLPSTEENASDTLGDISLTKSEELFLQQGLINFPGVDEKYSIPSAMDIGALSNSMGVLVPYFQPTLTNQQTMLQNPSTILPMQISDLIQSSYMQQTISEDMICLRN